MQSINPEPTEEEKEQIREIQRLIHLGKSLKEIKEAVRAKYAPPEYFKQQTLQKQENRL